MINPKKREKRQKDQKSVYIYNRRTLKFNEDEVGDAIEFRLAESYMKDIIKDFEENSEIWQNPNKKQSAIIFLISLIAFSWSTLTFSKSEKREIQIISMILSFILMLLSVYYLGKKHISGDDKAIIYFNNVKEVYNIQLFYHNLRIEMSYIEKKQKSPYKEDQFLALEFHVLKEYRTSKKNRNSFLTSDSTIGEVKSEKLSPFDEEIIKKKSGVQGHERSCSESSSNMQLISRRMELSVVDEEENFEKDESKRHETQQETERGLLGEGEEFEVEEKENQNPNFALNRGFQKNKKNFLRENREIKEDDGVDNISHEYKSPIKLSNSKDNQIAKYLSSNASNSIPIKFNSFNCNNTPKLASFKQSIKKVEISHADFEDPVAGGEEDEESFVKYSKEREKNGHLSFKEAIDVEIHLSNKKPKVGFDEISISPERKNRPQEVVQERVEEEDSGSLQNDINQPNFNN